MVPEAPKKAVPPRKLGGFERASLEGGRNLMRLLKERNMNEAVAELKRIRASPQLIESIRGSGEVLRAAKLLALVEKHGAPIEVINALHRDGKMSSDEALHKFISNALSLENPREAVLSAASVHYPDDFFEPIASVPPTKAPKAKSVPPKRRRMP